MMAWLRKADDALVQVVDDEMVLLNLATEQYYALNLTGRRFLDVCLASNGPDQAVEELVREYGVPADVIRRDLDLLLDGLRSRGLVLLG
jgi:hypothetical protein